ncbi:MAG: hypothetical protein U0835_16930 [Isosphaeraceae bacterium]
MPHVPKQPGAYRLLAKAAAADGSARGRAPRPAGPRSPRPDEFARLEPDRDYLPDPRREDRGRGRRPVPDRRVRRHPPRPGRRSPSRGRLPWHQPLYFLIAIGCLSEWGLRRFNGLA